jgi:hypothetical protein
MQCTVQMDETTADTGNINDVRKTYLKQTLLRAKAVGRRYLCYVINEKTDKVKYTRDIGARSRNHPCRGNAIRIT